MLVLAASQPNGDSAASVGLDGLIKFYAVATFDVRGMIRAARSGSGGGVEVPAGEARGAD
jgi:hypothetical protein